MAHDETCLPIDGRHGQGGYSHSTRAYGTLNDYHAHLSPRHLKTAVNLARLETIGLCFFYGTESSDKWADSTHLPNEPKLVDTTRELLEAASGIEPLNRSFADCSLNHLGTPPHSHICHNA